MSTGIVNPSGLVQTFNGGSGDVLAEFSKTGDAFPRIRITALGTILVGDGTVAPTSDLASGAWQAMTLAGNVTAVGGQPASRVRKVGSIVFAEINLSNSSGGTITDGTLVATMPAGFAPVTGFIITAGYGQLKVTGNTVVSFGSWTSADTRLNWAVWSTS